MGVGSFTATQSQPERRTLSPQPKQATPTDQPVTLCPAWVFQDFVKALTLGNEILHWQTFFKANIHKEEKVRTAGRETASDFMKNSLILCLLYQQRKESPRQAGVLRGLPHPTPGTRCKRGLPGALVCVYRVYHGIQSADQKRPK